MQFILKGDSRAICAKIKSLNPDETWVVTIEKAMNADQRKLYFKFIDSYAKHTGAHPIEVHEGMKEKFLQKPMDIVLVTEEGSTKDLTSPDFSNFMEQCMSYAAEEGFTWASSNE